MNVLEHIRDDLLRCAKLFLVIRHDWDFDNLRSIVAEHIASLFSLGTLDSIDGIAQAMDDYSHSDPGHLNILTDVSTRNLTLFTSVIGYPKEPGRILPGLISSVASHLPSVTIQDSIGYWNLVPEYVSMSCEVLADLCEQRMSAELRAGPTVAAFDEPLTLNDASLLQAMLNLKATVDKPTALEVIAHKAGVPDAKKNFSRLKETGLVSAKKGVGCYLTEAGIERATRVGGEL